MYNTDIESNCAISTWILDGPAVGDWVIINYDSKGYTGEPVQVLEDDYQINVKQRPLNEKFKWPEQPDCIFYKRQSIVRTILPPVPVGASNQFEFTQTGIFLLLNWCRQMLQKPMVPVFNPLDL